MNHTNIAERFEEIRLTVEEEDLSRASRRLLDFFMDFRLPPQLKEKAITLRSAYNSYAQLDQSSASAEKRNGLLDQASLLADDIEAYLAQKLSHTGYPNQAPGSAPITPDDFFKMGKQSRLKRGSPVFVGKGISKTFRRAQFVFKLPTLDLELKLGDVTGVVGENGNGKTTLLRIVAGDLEADSGSLLYPGFSADTNDWYRIKQHIAFIPQQLKSWQGLLKENLHFSAAIHGIKGKENEEQVNFIIHRLGLTQYKDAVWSEISSGFKLRFALARALVWKPQLLIIDEPLANLDINTQQVFLQDLKFLANSVQHPIAILLTSQHLHEVESIADNIIFMRNGEALYNGKMQDFGQNRDENLFELSTDATKSDILHGLKHIIGLKVEDMGQVKVIHVPTSVDSGEILKGLVAHQIKVNYFRDISTSTLKLFRENVEKN